MDSLSAPFTIAFNEQYISPAPSEGSELTQATLGSEPASFKLENGRLQSGDWYLGRNLTEDRSKLPKKVFWFKATPENAKFCKPVEARKEGDAYDLRFGGAPLIEIEGKIYAALAEGEYPSIE